MAEKPTRDQNKYVIRMPEGMRDKIREAAEANNRSMNAEIVSRLESSFQSVMAQIKEANRDNPMNDLVAAIRANADEARRTREIIEELVEEARKRNE